MLKKRNSILFDNIFRVQSDRCQHFLTVYWYNWHLSNYFSSIIYNGFFFWFDIRPFIPCKFMYISLQHWFLDMRIICLEFYNASCWIRAKRNYIKTELFVTVQWRHHRRLKGYGIQSSQRNFAWSCDLSSEHKSDWTWSRHVVISSCPLHMSSVGFNIRRLT